MNESEISLALTPGQVTGVLKAASAVGQPSLLSDVEQPRELISSPRLDDPKISKSLLLGLVVLISFPPDGSARANKDIARELDLAASTSHRYIQTLVAAGLLEQDPLTREYRRTLPCRTLSPRRRGRGGPGRKSA